MNKNSLGIFPAFEVPADGGGGGGTTTTAPPAEPPVIATRPAGPGMFGGGLPKLKTLPPDLEKKPETTTEVKPETKTEEIAKVPSISEKKYRVVDDDGKTILGDFDSQAEADAFLKSRTEKTTQTETRTDADSDSLSRPGMGRFKTLREFEDGYRRTEVEAQRLYNENRTLREAHQKELSDRETKLALMQAELEEARKTPAFPELSKEDLGKLAKEDPAAAAEYIAEKKFRDREAIARKQRTEADIRAREQRVSAIKAEIDRRSDQMLRDPENYPQYEDFVPVMDSIRQKLSYRDGYNPLDGHVWSGEVYYKLALAEAYLQAIKGARQVKSEAQRTAKGKAAADAAGVKSPENNGKGSGGATKVDPAVQEHLDWRNKVLGAGKKRVFG